MIAREKFMRDRIFWRTREDRFISKEQTKKIVSKIREIIKMYPNIIIENNYEEEKDYNIFLCNVYIGSEEMSVFRILSLYSDDNSKIKRVTAEALSGEYEHDPQIIDYKGFLDWNLIGADLEYNTHASYIYKLLLIEIDKITDGAIAVLGEYVPVDDPVEWKELVERGGYYYD